MIVVHRVAVSTDRIVVRVAQKQSIDTFAEIRRLQRQIASSIRKMGHPQRRGGMELHVKLAEPQAVRLTRMSTDYNSHRALLASPTPLSPARPGNI